MNAQTKQDTGSVKAWAHPKQSPQNLSPEVLKRWETATSKIAQLAGKNGWNKSEVARRADMAIGTFSGWYDGTYTGRYDTTTQKIENYIDLLVDAAETMAALPTDPGFLQTRMARELFEGFTYAQALPTISVITIASGLGKTCAAKAFACSRPHVFHVELSPASRRPHNLKVEIGDTLGISTRNSSTLKASIVEALKRDGFSALLIVDEAQNLGEDGINELRHFRDVAGCGLVLLGNNETTTPYASRDVRHSSPQVTRRIGHRLTVMNPYAEDIESVLDAWKITEPEARNVAEAIAKRPGAIGALVETIKAASLIARGMGTGLGAEHIKAAYQRRGGGGAL
ncbi:MAG: hypothetical protein CSA70_03530 [Rhodobacterales bacterium]|nr:MAG: hypothetical protein CSA70_03530 [Rhodobacterales bacterium]